MPQYGPNACTEGPPISPSPRLFYRCKETSVPTGCFSPWGVSKEQEREQGCLCCTDLCNTDTSSLGADKATVNKEHLNQAKMVKRGQNC